MSDTLDNNPKKAQTQLIYTISTEYCNIHSSGLDETPLEIKHYSITKGLSVQSHYALVSKTEPSCEKATAAKPQEQEQDHITCGELLCTLHSCRFGRETVMKLRTTLHC